MSAIPLTADMDEGGQEVDDEVKAGLVESPEQSSFPCPHGFTQRQYSNLSRILPQ
jgi:hypothetical protein